MRSRILISTIISAFLLVAPSVQAANFKDNQIVDSNKIWTIKFNNEVSLDDSTKEGISVTDSKGSRINTEVKLGKDTKTVLVAAPEEGYVSGENYTLNLGNKVRSIDGKALRSEYNLHFSIQDNETKTLNKNFETKVKSGNLSVDYTIDQAISDIEKFQLNTLNIPVKINIDTLSSNTMTVDKSSEYKAISLIKQLSGKNINIILEPYPWIANGENIETDWEPDNMSAFFSNWKTNVLKTLIDDIAEPYHVNALVIGSNLVKIEQEEKNWCDTIDYVKTYYKGLVTYRTNHWSTASWDPKSIAAYENKLNNKLFSKLDFISIAAYFELTNNLTNTVENLVSAIESSQVSFDGQIRNQNVKQEIKNFHDKWGKPIFFGELGFPRINGASIHPWDPYQDDIVNDVEQANCFEAYRREFENESWLLGFSIFAIGEHSLDKRYYPSEKSASVIKNWY